MKDFDKWLKKAYPDVEDYCRQCPSISADAWKAALEWVDTRIESAMVTPSVCDLPVQIRLDIQKELEG